MNRWLQWYEALGVEALVSGTAPGPSHKLTEAQRSELTALVEAGPLVAGFPSGVWTGPMVGDLIERRFGVRYHKHNVPRLLHELGFSLQRPRKRQTGARRCREAGDLAPQDVPRDKNKARACRGLVMFGDEANFWLDGSLHRTWARVGIQPHVDTFGMRKTAHVFGAVSLERRPRFHYLFAPVFKGATL